MMMQPHVKRYFVQFGGAMMGYMLVLFGSVHLLRSGEYGPVITGMLALSPVIPALFGLYAVLTFYRAIDEFQKRVIAEAMLIATLLVGFGTFAWGFLEGAMDLPAIPTIWIFPALIGTYGLMACLLKWRYS